MASQRFFIKYIRNGLMIICFILFNTDSEANARKLKEYLLMS